MHATTEQLLEIKDGLENDLSLHVSSCLHCQAELECLTNLSKQILYTAEQHPDVNAWQKIVDASQQHRVAAEHLVSRPESEVPLSLLAVANQNRSLSRSIYALAGSVLLTGVIGLFIFGQQGSAIQQTELLHADVRELMLNSRVMEQVLQKVAVRSDMLNSDQQTAVERLYWRLSYVDQLIHENSDDQSDDPQVIEALWSDRIDALSELNQLYYQRQQTLEDSEI